MGFSESVEFLKSNVDKIDGLDSHLSEIVGHVESLKQESIGHRKKATDVETKFTTLSKGLSDSGIDIAGDIVAEIAKIKNGKKGDTDEASRMNAELKEQIAALRLKMEADDKEKYDLLVKDAFKSKIEHAFYGGSVIMKTLISEGVLCLDKDKKPCVKIGENYYSPDTGLAKLREIPELREALRTTQSGGGGSQNGGTGQSKTMALADFNKLGAKAKAEFMSSGGKLI